MKQINYTGSSKLISRIVSLLNRKVPLPLDGDGNPDWGSNGQVLSTNGVDEAVWVNAGGGSGGHTIEDTSGADLPQEDNLQFVGVYTEDDSANDRTKVNIVRQMTKAVMETLSSAEQEGFIDTTDEDDDYIPIAAEDVKRGVSDIDADLTALENGKVNRSGDTMTGNLTIDRKDGTTGAVGHSYLTLGNSTPSGSNQNSSGLLQLFSEGAYPAILYANPMSQTRYINLPNRSGTLSMRTVTTLVNESVSIAANSGYKDYSALTATTLSAYDEIHFLASFGNVYVNGMATKAQMAAVTARTSPTNGRLYFYGGNVISSGSENINYCFRVRADASGLRITNGSISGSIDSLLIQGITY